MRRLLAGLVAILSLSLITAQLSEAAVTPGTKCSKAGATSTFNGKKYTCVKSGKKLVWNKGVALPKPAPVVTPTPSPSPITPVSPNNPPSPIVESGQPPLNLLAVMKDGNTVISWNSPEKPSFEIEEYELIYSIDEYMTQRSIFVPSTSYLMSKSEIENSFGFDKIYRFKVRGFSKGKIRATTFSQAYNLMINKNSGDGGNSKSVDPLCAADPLVPTEWKSYEKFALSAFNCARPYRFMDVALPSTTPISQLTSKNDLLPVAQCKLPAQNNYNNVGFKQNGWQFNGDLQIQVIPIQFTDYGSSENPVKEYSKYLEYIKEMYFKISDGNTRITYKVPDSYIQIGSDIKSYVVDGSLQDGSGIVWKKLDARRYERDVFNAADKVIDFTGIDMTIVLVPLSVPTEFIGHSSEFRMDNVRTNEGIVEYNYLMPPATEVDRRSFYGVEPFLHLHEIFHANGLLNDHLGDAGKGPYLGTGRWGHMSGMLTDFILWDKWIAGMLRDSQVICASPNSVGTYWIKPASYFGTFEKLLVIPLSSTRAIAIESERAAGMNFKIPEIARGALVYTLDTLDTRFDAGITVIRPENRTGPIQLGTFILADAPLKSGESLTVWGYKISVIESGDWGDVIKVEKA